MVRIALLLLSVSTSGAVRKQGNWVGNKMQTGHIKALKENTTEMVGLELEKERSNSSQMLSMESSGWLMDGSDTMSNLTESLGIPEMIDPVSLTLIRACVAERANDWAALHERLGIELPSHPPGQGPLEYVREIFQVDNLIEERSSGRSVGQQMVHLESRSSSMKEWNARKRHARKVLLKWNFHYKAAFDRCKKGMTTHAYQCMMEKAQELCENKMHLGADDTIVCESLLKNVQTRLDARDLVLHLKTKRGVFGRMGFLERTAWKKIGDLNKKLEEAKYSWGKIKKKCKKHLKNEVKFLHNRTLSEFSQAVKIHGTCHEAPGKMCPEGTFATTKRRYNIYKGAAVWGTAALISKFTFVPLVGLIGGAVGGAPGAAAATTAAFVIQFPICFLIGFFSSRGPLECACFPRVCSFSKDSGTCQLELHDMPSGNPYSTTLPLLGMKCSLSYKKEDKCNLQQCTDADYSTAIDGKMFGTLGPMKKGIHNCLSINPNKTGSFATVPELPNGEPNTIEGRNEIYNRFFSKGS